MDQLDTLQKELDKVLEQVGKVLAANNEKSVMAAGAKLKHVLPGAQENFHRALDHLSEDIEHARLVMRRDLAVGALPKPEPEKVKSPIPSPAAVKEPTSAPADEAPPAESPSKKAAGSTPAADAEPPAPAEKPTSPPAPSPPPTDKPAPTPPKDPNNEGESEKHPPTQPDTTNNNTADNDNISALLPGLQDYANNSSGGGGTADDIDFDDIFGDAGAAADLGDAQPGDGGLGDFMDFDFDAEFGASGGGDGGGGEFGTGTGNGNGVDDVDFFKFD